MLKQLQLSWVLFQKRQVWQARNILFVLKHMLTNRDLADDLAYETRKILKEVE